jgi:hypothetical protein
LSNLGIEDPVVFKLRNYKITQLLNSLKGFGAAKAARKGLVIWGRGLRGFRSAALSGAVIRKPGRTGNFDRGGDENQQSIL